MESEIHLINGKWCCGHGPEFQSVNPATSQLVWHGCEATGSQVDLAIRAAESALEAWSDKSFEERAGYLIRFSELLEKHAETLAETISKEVGKPLWESRTEVRSMAAKVRISIEAYHKRCGATLKTQPSGIGAVTRFKPHGVVAVFGPFNFPGHLPNGHIVPALLAGNTVIFKPSEYAPLVSRTTLQIWTEAGLPPGVLNLIQGGREPGSILAAHPRLNGLYFTGSSQTGLMLSRLFAEHPEKILALEMGGNNPLLIFEPGDLKIAAFLAIQSSFISAGQRCSCARRLIIPDNHEGTNLLQELLRQTEGIRVGAYTDVPEPFMGPVVSSSTAVKLLESQARLLERGGVCLKEMRLLKSNTGLLSPGIIDVTSIQNREDTEWFGPMLQVIRVPDFIDAIHEANSTQFGLTAGLISQRKDLYDKFFRKVRAGVVNWNQQLTGASSELPFGGVGKSGNHRPGAAFAADYCAYPVASMEADLPALPSQIPPGLAL